MRSGVDAVAGGSEGAGSGEEEQPESEARSNMVTRRNRSMARQASEERQQTASVRGSSAAHAPSRASMQGQIIRGVNTRRRRSLLQQASATNVPAVPLDQPAFPCPSPSPPAASPRPSRAAPAASPSSTTSRSTSKTARRAPSSGRAGAGRRRSSASAPGSTSPRPAPSSLCGEALDDLDEDDRARTRGRSVGFIFQQFRLIPTLTALENVSVPLELRGERADAEAARLLDRVGLGDRTSHYPTQLSGGEQQRVALARAFINRPRILFADEPTGNLDAETSERVEDLLFDLNAEAGTALVVVTHDLDLARRTERVLKLRGGRLVSDEAGAATASTAPRHRRSADPQHASPSAASIPRRMFSPTFAWRDSRSARRRLLLFVASMALGVAALVAIRSFADSLETAVTEQAQTLTGSDLTLSARRPFGKKDRALVDSMAQAYPGAQSRELAFASMAFFPETGNARLTEIRALEGAFPYYGEIATTPDSAAATYQQRGEALVDASLLLQFDAVPGDSVRVGERTYRIAGAIDEIAGQTGVGSFVGPRVYVPLAALDTSLVGFGSRVEYRRHFLFDDADPDAVLAEIQPKLDAQSLRGETAAGAQEDWNDALGNLNRFLALVGFVALLLGGIGVASAITVYVRQKADTIATLRCLGATAGQTLRAYVLQAAALGLLGALLGAALGVAVQTLLPLVLGPFLPVDVDFAVSWGAVAEGVGLGLAVALVFALLPLVRIRRIPPLRAIRPGAEAEGRFDWLRGVDLSRFIALGVAAFAFSQTGDWRAAVGFPLGVGAVLGLLALAAWATTAAVRRFFPSGWPYTARQGLANLYRPGNQTLVLMLTLGLGTFLITTLYLVQTSLLDQVAITIRRRAARPHPLRHPARPARRRDGRCSTPRANPPSRRSPSSRWGSRRSTAARRTRYGRTRPWTSRTGRSAANTARRTAPRSSTRRN